MDQYSWPIISKTTQQSDLEKNRHIKLTWDLQDWWKLDIFYDYFLSYGPPKMLQIPLNEKCPFVATGPLFFLTLRGHNFWTVHWISFI